MTLSLASPWAVLGQTTAPDPPHAEPLREMFGSALRHLRPVTGETPAAGLARAALENAAKAFDSVVALTAVEDVHRIRFSHGGEFRGDSRGTLTYEIQFTEAGRRKSLQERHRPVDVDTPRQSSAIDVQWPLGFADPQVLERARFQFLGIADGSGGAWWNVVAVTGFPTGAALQLNISSGEMIPCTPVAAVLWIEPETRSLTRLWVKLRPLAAAQNLDAVFADLRYGEINVPGLGGPMRLPLTTTITLTAGANEDIRVQRYRRVRPLDASHGDIVVEAAGVTPEPIELVVEGVHLIESDKARDAVSVLKRAVTDGAPAPADYYLGVAFYRDRQFAEAEAALREAVRKAPAFAEAHNQLGGVLYQRGDKRAAVEQFEACIRIEADNPAFHANLAMARQGMGDRAQAIQETRLKSLEHSTDDVESQRGATIRVEVREVLVPVVVTDTDGHTAMGLQQSDFAVLEDSVPQEITSFRVERMENSAPEPERTEAKPRTPVRSQVPRTASGLVLVCMDTMHMTYAHSAAAASALARLFEQEPAGTTRYALVTLGGALRVLQSGTHDPKEILALLRDPKALYALRSNNGRSTEAEMRDFHREIKDIGVVCDESGASRTPCSGQTRLLLMRARMLAREEEHQLVTFLSQLQALIGQLSNAPYRKSVILISEGFSMYPGQQAYRLLESYFPYQVRETSLGSNFRLGERLEPILRLATKLNVTIYTIDARGLYTSELFDASTSMPSVAAAPQATAAIDGAATSAGDTLTEIAAESGGIAVRNTNDLFRGLQRALKDGREYYVLGYVSRNVARDGKFRAITVRTRERNMVVRAKKGYWAPTE